MSSGQIMLMIILTAALSGCLPYDVYDRDSRWTPEIENLRQASIAKGLLQHCSKQLRVPKEKLYEYNRMISKLEKIRFTLGSKSVAQLNSDQEFLKKEIFESSENFLSNMKREKCEAWEFGYRQHSPWLNPYLESSVGER